MKRPVLLFLAIIALTVFSVVYHMSIVVLPVLIAGAVYLLIKRKMTGLIIISLLFLFITFAHTYYLTQQTTLLDGFHNTDVTITAQVIEYPEYIDGRTRAVFKIISVEGIDGYEDSDKILLSVYGKKVHIAPGEIYQITGRLKVPEPETNPGGFDYRFYLQTQKLYLTMWTEPEDIRLIDKEPLFLQYDRLLLLRSNIINTIDTHLPKQESSVLTSIIFGSSEIDAEVLENFRHIGIAHVLAVSGLHTGIIYLFIQALLRLFRAGKKTTFFLTTIGLIGYILLTGMSVSVIRASIMLWFLCLANLMGKKGDSFNFLCIAAMLILLLNPLAIFTVSFQMSFVAVLSIVLFVPVIENKIRTKSKYLRKLLLFISVSMIVQIAVAPITAYYFHTFSPVSLLANLLIVPMIGVLLVTALFGLIFTPLPQIADILFVIVEKLLSYSIYIADVLAKLPYAYLYVKSPRWYVFVLIYTLMLCGFGYLHRKKEKDRKFALVMLSVVFISFTISYLPPLFTKVYFIDVGFGDSALIHTNQGETVLIDGGGYLSNDTATYDILPLLEECNIRSLDAVIVTHSDSDHIKGIIGIIGKIKIKQIYANDDGGALYDSLIEKADIHDIPVKNVCEGDIITAGDVELYVLNPTEEILSSSSRNNLSIIIRAEIQDHTLLFLGDAGKSALDGLIDHELLSDTEIIKASHHGGYYSNLDELYTITMPQLCVISVGANGYRLPSEETIELLDSMQISYLRTDKSGCITLILRDNEINIKTYLQSN